MSIIVFQNARGLGLNNSSKVARDDRYNLNLEDTKAAEAETIKPTMLLIGKYVSCNGSLFVFTIIL